MNGEPKTMTVLIEEAHGPVEFKVCKSESGSLKWGVGRYVLSGRPCVRLSDAFVTRLREAVKLIKETEIC